MKKTNSRYLDFFDRNVSKMVCEKYGMSEVDSIRSFLTFETSVFTVFTGVVTPIEFTNIILS